MRDLFLVYHSLDTPAGRGLADDLAGHGLELGRPVELWPPGIRLLREVDAGLVDARFAVVVVTWELLKLELPAKEWDGLAGRRKVIALLHGVGEAQVARASRRLATAALAGELADRLPRLVGRAGEADDAGGNGSWS